MAIDAVFPAASELVMVYGGALASGALAARARRRSAGTRDGLRGLLAVVARRHARLPARRDRRLGDRLHGGRPFLERHGRWFHLDARALERAERWFDRWGRLGRVPRSHHAGRPLVRLDPGRRLREPARALQPAHPARERASGASSLAGVGWALGSSWDSFDHGFRYAEIAVVAGIVGRVRRTGSGADAAPVPSRSHDDPPR